MKIDLFNHQYEFIADTTTDNIGLVCGFGAGKTHAFCMKAIHLASLNIGCVGILCEPTHSMVMDVLVPKMFEVLELMDIQYKYKASPSPSFKLKFPTGKATLLLRSAENHKRLRGIDAAFAGADEVDMIKPALAKEVYISLTSRMRDPKAKVKQFFMSSTPEGFGFLYNFFVKDADKERDPIKKQKLENQRKLIQGSTYDNPYITQDVIDSWEGTFSGPQLEAYLHGKFVNMKNGTVYYNFDKKIHHTTKSLADKEYKNYPLHIGIDFNYGKMSAVVAISVDEKVYVVDEIMGCEHTDALIEEIQYKYPNRKIFVYPDSSGKNQSANSDRSSIQKLKAAGFQVKCLTRNPFVRDRIASVNALYKNGKGEIGLFINTDTCPMTTDAQLQQAYNEHGQPEKHLDTDHPNDALGYMVYFNFPISGSPKATIY